MAALFYGQPLKKLTALANDLGVSNALGVGYSFLDSLGNAIWGIIWDSSGNATWNVYATGTVESILNVRCKSSDRRIQMRDNNNVQAFRFTGSGGTSAWFATNGTPLVTFDMGTVETSTFANTSGKSLLTVDHDDDRITLDKQDQGTDTGVLGKLLTGSANAPLFMTGTITTSTNVSTDSGTTAAITGAVAGEDYTLQLTLQQISGIFADQGVDGIYDPATMTIDWSISGTQSSGVGVSWVLNYTLVHKRAGLYNAL